MKLLVVVRFLEVVVEDVIEDSGESGFREKRKTDRAKRKNFGMGTPGSGTLHDTFRDFFGSEDDAGRIVLLTLYTVKKLGFDGDWQDFGDENPVRLCFHSK